MDTGKLVEIAQEKYKLSRRVGHVVSLLLKVSHLLVVARRMGDNEGLEDILVHGDVEYAKGLDDTLGGVLESLRGDHPVHYQEACDFKEKILESSSFIANLEGTRRLLLKTVVENTPKGGGFEVDFSDVIDVFDAVLVLERKRAMINFMMSRIRGRGRRSQ
jgi:hypothetical protein